MLRISSLFLKIYDDKIDAWVVSNLNGNEVNKLDKKLIYTS